MTDFSGTGGEHQAHRGNIVVGNQRDDCAVARQQFHK